MEPLGVAGHQKSRRGPGAFLRRDRHGEHGAGRAQGLRPTASQFRPPAAGLYHLPFRRRGQAHDRFCHHPRRSGSADRGKRSGKNGGKTAFIDAEHAIDPRYAKALGVDVDELILSQPDSGEQALEIAEVLIKSGAIDLIVIDSVAALVPQAELDGEMGDSNIGLHARLMSKAMRKLAGAMNSNNCTTIFINQLREKVGVMFGNPEVTTGGRALKFYSTIRLEVRKSEAIKDGTEIIGNKVNVKVAKNKVAPPFKTCQVEIYYGQGISHVSEIISLGVEFGIIEKSGSWFSYNGEKIGQGSEAVKKYLEQNPDIDKQITEQVKAQMFKKEAEE